MVRSILMATLLVTGASVAQSPEAPRGPVFMVPADASCADWLAERRGQGKYRWESDVSWFQGFVAGHNVYAKPPDSRQILADPYDVELWLDTYCQKDPTRHLVHGAVEYIATHGGSNPLLTSGK
jgi:hypothetical protein